MTAPDPELPLALPTDAPISPDEQHDLLDEWLRICERVPGDWIGRGQVLADDLALDVGEPDPDDVAELLGRMLRWLGLPQRVHLIHGPLAEIALDDGSALAHQGSIGLFLHLDAELATFGYDPEAHLDVEEVVATLAHEASHAFRAHHRLDLIAFDEDGAPRPQRDWEQRQREELLTDATTVLLGFGVPLANTNRRVVSGGELEGAYAVSWHQVRHQGYLPTQALAYLLAVQILLLDDAALRGHVEASLDRNPLHDLQTSLTALALLRHTLTAQFATAASHAGEGADALPGREVLADSFDSEATHTVETYERAPLSERSVGRPTFRVFMNQPSLGTVGAFLLMAAVSFAIGIYADAVWLGALATFVFGIPTWTMALRRRYWVCSDPSCTEVVQEDTALCPGCGATILHAIDSFDDRLEAEEAWEDAQVSAASDPA